MIGFTVRTELVVLGTIFQELTFKVVAPSQEIVEQFFKENAAATGRILDIKQAGTVLVLK